MFTSGITDDLGTPIIIAILSLVIGGGVTQLTGNPGYGFAAVIVFWFVLAFLLFIKECSDEDYH